MMHRVLLSVCLPALVAISGGCQLHPRPLEALGDLPPAAPTPVMPYSISNMHVQMVHGHPYLFTRLHTSFNGMAAPVWRTFAALQHLAASGKIHPTGPALLIYHDPSEDLSKPFDLEIGMPVHDAASPVSEYQLRQVPTLRCATLIYRGPLRYLPKAYDKLIPEMIAAGFTPSEETRERYLVWEDADSLNNVVQIEVGVSVKRGKIAGVRFSECRIIELGVTGFPLSKRLRFLGIFRPGAVMLRYSEASCRPTRAR